MLNGITSLSIALGVLFIRRGRRRAHHRSMLVAFAAAAVFLVLYLTRFAVVGVTPFTGQGWLRVTYLALLGSHELLALISLPLVLLTLARGLRGRFGPHRRLGRVTWPLWLYVSVTGVVVYLMLY